MRRVAAFAFLGVAALFAGCSDVDEGTVAPAGTPVRVATATAGPAAPPIRTNGMLANADEFRLAFKVGGVIRRIAVNEGDRVRRGQKLAEIEQTEIDAQVEQARQAYDKAKRDYERGERLYRDSVISLEQLEDLKTQTAVAAAALRAAEFNRDYAAIIAPHDGTVLRRLAEERELVAAGAPILVLGALERGFVVRAGLADREIVQVRQGDAAQVRLDALPDAVLTATITEVASAADPASGLFMIEAALDATDLPLKSGLVAKLTIAPSAASAGSLVYVPIAAIVEGEGQRASVFVPNEGRAERRVVNVAFIEGERVALRDGLQAGEQIITDGALYLEHGEAISIVPDDETVGAAMSDERH
jgi:RND family efflux transporter, MFP subunit